MGDIYFHECEIKSGNQCKHTLGLVDKCPLIKNVSEIAEKNSIGDEKIGENAYERCFPCLNMPVDLMCKYKNQIGEPNLIIQLSRLSNHSHYILNNWQKTTKRA